MKDALTAVVFAIAAAPAVIGLILTGAAHIHDFAHGRHGC